MKSDQLSETGLAAGFARLRRLKVRREFLEAAKGVRAHRTNVSLQRRAREDGDPVVGLGFTVTKKEGNSVERNRIRRRLREAARAVAPVSAEAGADYVLVGRRAALDSPFPSLLADLKEAFAEARKRAARRNSPAKPAPAPSPAPPISDETPSSDDRPG